MKIVYVDETFHPAYGYQSNPLAKFQQKQGNEIVIVTVSKDQLHPVYKAFGDTGESVERDDARYMKETGVRIVRVPTKGYFMHRAVYDRSLFAAVRAEKPDVVFVHCVETLTAMRFLLHKKEWPLLFDSHMLSMASESRLVGLYEAFYRLFFRKIIEKNHYYVIRTQDDDYVNKHLGIDKALTPLISFGTDTLLFQPSAENRKEFRKQNHISEDTFVVTYTGKLTEAKGGMLLAETFHEQFKHDVTLVCVGSPPDDEYGKTVAEELEGSRNRIIRFPTQSYMDLPVFYQMADLSIFPKQCSMSFYDAQACGLPVVSEQNNVNEQRCSHHNGANFIPGSVDDFRDKIEWFAGMSVEERKQYSENARRFIEDGYDYADIARQYTDYLKKAVEDYKRKKGKN
ncbi:MAG: glycosyltransferase [Lachnospiraceae bacterium]|nr:glycosyltransferase [Lachnospiraceae bacterium]